MKMSVGVALLLSVAFIGVVPRASGQQMYKKVGPDGTVMFTTAPTDPDFAADGPAHVGASHHEDESSKSSVAADGMYDYDQAGRLASSTRGGQTTTYQYDGHNNLPHSESPDAETTYEYGDDNRILSGTVRSLR